MTAPTNETEIQPPPLLPLEYCSPERAARLLGCEVDDIFHWVATGAISLFAEFCQFKVDTDHADIVSEEYWREYSHPDGTIQSYHGPDEFSLHIYSPRLQYFIPDDESKESELKISGLWFIDYIDEFTSHVLSRIYEETRCNLTAFFESTKPMNTFRPSLTLYDVPVTDMPDRLRIRRDDLERLQRHIISGEVMHWKSRAPIPINLYPSMKKTDQTVSSSARVTSKQCGFIVDLLRSHGLTDDDFQGSIGALRLKIANRAPNIGDPELDDNTLSDWLRKAGVRS